MSPPEVRVLVRRVHDAAHAAEFTAAWLVAGLGHPVALAGVRPDAVELHVRPDDELLVRMKELLAEPRFDGWQLSHE